MRETKEQQLQKEIQPSNERPLLLKEIENYKRSLSSIPIPYIMSSVERKLMQTLSNDFIELFSEIVENDDLKSKVRALIRTLKILNQKYQSQGLETYIHLALAALNNIDKIILGKFLEYGGFKPGIWKVQIDHKIFLSVIDGIEQKLDEETLESLLKYYNNKDIVGMIKLML